MGALIAIENLISQTSPINEVKAGGDAWYQPLGGTEVATDVWEDEGGGWVVKNFIEIKINGVLVFNREEEDVVNFDCELYKIMVLAQREKFLEKMLVELISLGY